MNLKSSIHPKRLTPQLMLAFVGFCERWPSIHISNTISPAEQGKVDAIKASMVNYAVRVLFSDELRASAPRPLRFSGIQIVRELFVGIMKELYPRYATLWSAGEQGLKDYTDALGKLTLKEKRGQKPLDEQRKQQLRQIFGGSAWTTFATRAKSGYTTLLKLAETRGDQAQITLTLQPMEVVTLKEFEKTGQVRFNKGQELPVMSSSQFLILANNEGYRDEEAKWILRLLVARELVNTDKGTSTIARVPAGPAPEQVKKRLDELLSDINSLPTSLAQDREKQPLLKNAEALRDRFSPELDDESLDELSVEIGKIESLLVDLLTMKRGVFANTIDELLRKLEDCQREHTRAPELEENIGPGLDFRRTIVDMQRELNRERIKLARDIEQGKLGLVEIQKQITSGVGSIDAKTIVRLNTGVEKGKKTVQDLVERSQKLDRSRIGLRDWLKLVRESDELYKSLETVPELRTKLTDDVVHRIMQNFARRQFEALVEDAEQFRIDFDEIARQRETWVTAKRNEFLARKETLRNWLKVMKIDRTEFPARYDHLEHDQSYEEMHEQVLSIVRQHLDSISKRLDESRLDLRQARQIQWSKLETEQRETLKSLEKDVTKLGKLRDTAVQSLSQSVVANGGKPLDDYSQSVAEILTDIDRLNKDSRQFLRPIEPKTDSEKAVLALLREQREMDLTDLVLKTDTNLTEIAEGLIGLYQGNQVVIKVIRRG